VVLIIQFGEFLYCISVLVKHPDDGRKSDRTLRRILIYIKMYCISVHLLLFYVSVNSVRQHFKELITE